MNTDTLYSVFSPVEQYRQFLRTTGAPVSSPNALSAIDAYLMKQLADAYPTPPTVIDMAATESQGETTALWAAQANIYELCVPCNPEQSPLRMLWRAYCSRCGIKSKNTPQFFTRSVTEERKASRETPSSDPHLLINLLNLDEAGLEVLKQIEALSNDLMTTSRKPSFLVLGLGKLGVCPALHNFLVVKEHLKGYRFQLARELNPFLASSSLGILYPESERFMGEIFARLSRQFEGNLDYSSVLRDLVANSLAYNQEIKETNEKLSDLRQENQQLHTLLAQSRVKEVIEVSVPVPLPIHSPPRPLFFTRYLGRLFRSIIPAKLNAARFMKKPSALWGFRQKYHSRVALVYRIVLRDLRILFIGR